MRDEKGDLDTVHVAQGLLEILPWLEAREFDRDEWDLWCRMALDCAGRLAQSAMSRESAAYDVSMLSIEAHLRRVVVDIRSRLGASN